MAYSRRLSKVLAVPVGDMIGEEGAEVTLFEAPVRLNVTKVTLFGDAIAKSATNYADATITNKGTTGSGTTTVAARGTDSTAVTAFVGWDLSRTLTNTTIEKDECLAFAWAETASTAPTTLVNGTVQVEFIAPYDGPAG